MCNVRAVKNVARTMLLKDRLGGDARKPDDDQHEGLSQYREAYLWKGLAGIAKSEKYPNACNVGIRYPQDGTFFSKQCGHIDCADSRSCGS